MNGWDISDLFPPFKFAAVLCDGNHSVKYHTKDSYFLRQCNHCEHEALNAAKPGVAALSVNSPLTDQYWYLAQNGFLAQMPVNTHCAPLAIMPPSWVHLYKPITQFYGFYMVSHMCQISSLWICFHLWRDQEANAANSGEHCGSRA